MGTQIIRQPDGQLAVFSSVVDCWTIIDATPEDVADYFAEKAAAAERERTEREIAHVLAGEPRKAYYQFARTFDEANAVSREHDGAWWRDGEWINFRPAEEGTNR